MLISTRQLRAFLSVVKYGNFTKAADRMHITQAGQSGMIRELETQLQCRLFNRTTRSVELTEAGSLVFLATDAYLQKQDVTEMASMAKLKATRLSREMAD
jgi:DNA-binding transcriptional LysR family regulator